MESLSNASNTSKKRPSKSLRRACWECKTKIRLHKLGSHAKDTTGKKRKVHGNASQTDLSSYAIMDNTGSDRVDEANPCSKHIQERLCKLEQLFERFVCRKNATAGPATTVPQSPALTASGTSEKETRPDMPGHRSDAYSTSSLGDGIVSRTVPLCRLH
jgi:hypothetical protein